MRKHLTKKMIFTVSTLGLLITACKPKIDINARSKQDSAQSDSEKAGGLGVVNPNAYQSDRFHAPVTVGYQFTSNIKRFIQASGVRKTALQDFDGTNNNPFKFGYEDVAKVFVGADSRLNIDIHYTNEDGYGKLSLVRGYSNLLGSLSTSRFITGDFNGDDISDIAHIFKCGPSMDQVCIDVFEGRADRTFFPMRWASSQGGNWPEQQWFALDANGDKVTDLAKCWADRKFNPDHFELVCDVHISVVNNGVAARSFRMERWATNQGWIDNRFQGIVGDFNGDGKEEFALVFPSAEGDHFLTNIDVHTSTGTSFGIERKVTNDGWLSENQTLMAADVNGDGKTDIVKYWANRPSCQPSATCTGMRKSVVEYYMAGNSAFGRMGGGEVNIGQFPTNNGDYFDERMLFLQDDQNNVRKMITTQAPRRGNDSVVRVHSYKYTGTGAARAPVALGSIFSYNHRLWVEKIGDHGEFNSFNTAPDRAGYNETTPLALRQGWADLTNDRNQFRWLMTDEGLGIAQ